MEYKVEYKGYTLKVYNEGQYPVVNTTTCDEFATLKDAKDNIDSGEVEFSE